VHRPVGPLTASVDVADHGPVSGPSADGGTPSVGASSHVPPGQAKKTGPDRGGHGNGEHG
jgi:hypothetical protein